MLQSQSSSLILSFVQARHAATLAQEVSEAKVSYRLLVHGLLSC